MVITKKTQNDRKAETKRTQNESFIVVATVAWLGIFNCSLNLYLRNSWRVIVMC